MGYGNDVSKFAEKKRVVRDKNLGPLIATDMTRCIHCTRCVRFGSEIAGIRELGATGRGEHMEIGTYITRNVTSEMSGNVIDLCPVGALTSKPFRFSARAWELIERDSIAPHDCIGSNLQLHIRGGKEVVRVVPRENEDINETWISDRDRFSYEALNSEDRVTTPQIKVDGVWLETDWQTALQTTITGVNRVIAESGADQFGVLASPTATAEELYLLQKLARKLRINNIDHRIRQTDFSFENVDPVFPYLGQEIRNLEKNDAVLLIGSNVRKDQPIIAHRLRKGSHNGLKLMHLNAVDYDFYIPIVNKIIISPKDYASELAAICKAVIDKTGVKAPEGFDSLASSVSVSDTHRQIAENLVNGSESSVILGIQALNHPMAYTLRILSSFIATATKSHFGCLPDASNSAGSYITGMTPHRAVGGKSSEQIGLNASEMLRKGLQGFLLLNIEPDIESAAPMQALSSLNNADFVVVLSSFVSENIRQYADVILPVTPFTETSGTFINVEGKWQSFAGAVSPAGDSRPAWKVLRVLGNLFGVDGFEYISSEEVLDELKNLAGNIKADYSVNWICPKTLEGEAKGELVRVPEIQMYAGDYIQRRAQSLQSTYDADVAAIRINKSLAEKLGFVDGAKAIASQNGTDVTLPIIVDDQVSNDSVLIHAGLAASAKLDSSFTPITIKPVS